MSRPPDIVDFCPVCETPISEFRPIGLVLISDTIPRSMEIHCLCGTPYTWHCLTGRVEYCSGRRLPRKEAILLKMKVQIGKDKVKDRFS